VNGLYPGSTCITSSSEKTSVRLCPFVSNLTSWKSRFNAEAQWLALVDPSMIWAPG
jgi:hypothetical protein